MDPCSRVGHVFRQFVVAKGNGSVIFTNAVRVAEVWMDDYKNYFYEMNNYRNVSSLNFMWQNNSSYLHHKIKTRIFVNMSEIYGNGFWAVNEFLLFLHTRE